jgi:hypothetical protein
MNPFKDTIYKEKNGRVYQLHWKNRYDPVTIAIVAGTAISAAGAVQQGYAAQQQAEAEQELMEYNATIKEREAAAQLERSREEARKFGKEAEAFSATQQVQLAKGGVLSSIGTPALLLEDTAMELEADRLQILRDGFLAESFALSEAEGQRFSGRAAKIRGDNALTGSLLSAGGTLLTGFGTASALKSPRIDTTIPTRRRLITAT